MGYNGNVPVTLESKNKYKSYPQNEPKARVEGLSQISGRLDAPA